LLHWLKPPEEWIAIDCDAIGPDAASEFIFNAVKL
jgi:hypothetical protein